MAILRKRIASPSREPAEQSSSEIASFSNEHEHEHEHEHLPEYSNLEEDAILQEQEQEQLSPSSAIAPISQSKSTGEIKIAHYTCSLFLDELATWYWVKTKQRLSDTAVNVLADQGLLEQKDLRPISACEEGGSHSGPVEPISGLALATFGTVQKILGGVVDLGSGIIQTHTQTPQDADANPNATANAKDHRGLTRITLSTLSAPRDFTLALTEGLQNAPRLYGDDEVRPRPQIAGVGSGMVAAGKGFGLGLYDGLSGFVRQPIQGAKTGGVVGCAKGVGRGIGGLVCKPCAGACGVPAYALQGVHVSIENAINNGRSASKMMKMRKDTWTMAESWKEEKVC